MEKRKLQGVIWESFVIMMAGVIGSFISIILNSKLNNIPILVLIILITFGILLLLMIISYYILLRLGWFR